MNTVKSHLGIRLNSFSDRLREERERLGLSQVAFGELGGVKKLAQSNYESGARSPDADYLGKIAEAGVDVAYVLTGRRADGVQALGHGGPDLALLEVCLAGVEEGLAATHRVMAPDKKAQLVTMLYDLHQAADSPPQKATILQFIKRAA